MTVNLQLDHRLPILDLLSSILGPLFSDLDLLFSILDHLSSRWRLASAFKPPRPWTTPISLESFTGTSSRPISCCRLFREWKLSDTSQNPLRPACDSGSRTSAWPAWRAPETATI